MSPRSGGAFFLRLALFSFLCLGFVVHGQDLPAGPQPPLPTIELRIGPARMTAELARTPMEEARGLMYRKQMGDNEGMLFMLPSEEQAKFWMENTLLPLSVAYLDKEGRIVEIYDMRPLDTTAINSRSAKIAYALEANQGWFALNKIGPGEIVHAAGAAFGKPPLAPAQDR